MKHLVFILTMIVFCITGFSQAELIVGARPIAMGYCSSDGNKCNGEITSIVGGDISGLMLQIYFKKEEKLALKLFKNGELIEDVFSINFNTVKVSKKNLLVSCNSFHRNISFHSMNGPNALRSLCIDISLKKKTGKVSFHYPEESRMFIYLFNLL